MKNTVLKFGSYGFVTGLIIFLIHLIIGVDNFDSKTNEIVGYISIFISLAFIYFGIKHYRDNVNNGVVSFGKAISIGLMISTATHGSGMYCGHLLRRVWINVPPGR